MSNATVPEASAAQQNIVDRIAMQRQRLRTRHVARAQAQVLANDDPSNMEEASGLWRAVTFAREHPAVVAAMAGVAIVAGPKRMLRWLGFGLPLLMRLRR